MIGDNARRCIIESSIPKGLFVRARFSFEIEPLKEGETPIENPNLCQTNGLYYIKYLPIKLYKWGPFLLRCDLFDGEKIRVADYKSVLGQANGNGEKAKFFKFLIEWTNISPKLFEIAKEHYGMPIPFSFKIEKYYRTILKKQNKRKGLVFMTESEREMQREQYEE